VSRPNVASAIGLLLAVLGLLQLGTLTGATLSVAGFAICTASLVVVRRANRRTR
jgi:hypothetical protein